MLVPHYGREEDCRRVIYHQAMENGQFFDEEFKTAVRLAGAQARFETLQAGIPVFYRDDARNLDVVEYPGGRRFEVRYVDGVEADRNYEVLGELKETAA